MPSCGTGETAIQRGVVSIFYSGAKWVSGTSVNDSAADVTMFGGDQFGWFGWSLGLSVWKGQVSAITYGDHGHYVIIG